MSKITLTDLANLQNETTAVNAINNNNAVLETASDNTLSRDGTAPNAMGAELDMNSNQILNLPAPATVASPLRLQDLNDFIGGGTITSLPAGGTTGQALLKASNANYDINWGNTVSSVGLALPADFNISSSPVTTSGTLTGAWATTPTGTGAVVRATSPTLVTPILGTPTSGTLTNTTGFPVANLAGLGTNVATFLATPSSANLRGALTDETGTGLAYFQGGDIGTPSAGVGSNLTALNATQLTTGTLPAARTNGHMNGEPSNGSASAGEVGEYIESVIASGSSVALTSSTAANVTSITLTAGDWDLSGCVVFNSAATTSFTNLSCCGSTTSATFQIIPGRVSQMQMSAIVPNTIPLSSAFGPFRFSLSGSQQVFLVAFAVFTVSTATAFGTIRARRVR